MKRFVSFIVFVLLTTGIFAQVVRVRITASNLTSGDYQSYEAAGKRILKGLKPDIVLMQEFNFEGTAGDFIKEVFGEGFQWFIEPGSEQIPNGVVSRWPIIESGEWEDKEVSNRDFAWVRIDIPGPKDLWAVSVHLLTTGSTVRATEASALVQYIQGKVPAGDYLVVGGDLNTNSRTENALQNLSAVVLTGSPYPADQNGNGNTNKSRAEPYDWVLVNSALDGAETSVVIGNSTYTNGLVFDSRVYTPLSEVSPVLSGDSGVSGMQHMAVVRDFLIPDSGPTPTPTQTPTPTATSTPGPTPTPTPTPSGFLDAGGYKIYQTDRNVSVSIPEGTNVPAGGTIIIGRAVTQIQFETKWGVLPSNTIYFRGATLAGDATGFPVINGGNQFRVENSAGNAVDPTTGSLPAPAVNKGEVHRRTSTSAEAFTISANSYQNGTPGRYEGVIGQTGRLVITEVSDATDYEYEFLELYYDAATPSTGNVFGLY
ncbi:MAG TPA: endonuclease [Candidatus Sumerlaeota bacterium]|nr:endonuclease [Candidatus Sumerlaeota bacterium]